eukprot:158367_1
MELFQPFYYIFIGLKHENISNQINIFSVTNNDNGCEKVFNEVCKDGKQYVFNERLHNGMEIGKFDVCYETIENSRSPARRTSGWNVFYSAFWMKMNVKKMTFKFETKEVMNTEHSDMYEEIE